MLKSARQSIQGVPSHGMLRSLVAISELGVPDCLLFAIEHEFEAVQVVAYRDVASACRPFEHPVALLLADMAALGQAKETLSHFRHIHPLTAIAAMVEDERDAARFYATSPVSASLRGILPMNLKLDLWLSVVALLLRGGEYFPAAMLRSGKRMKEPGEETAWALVETGNRFTVSAQASGAVDLSVLTSRELEVLRHVSRGTQNKLIAAELGLSENTVKIHMHNVIRKLGTRNRTEAAAVFLHGMAAISHPANAPAASATELH